MLIDIITSYLSPNKAFFGILPRMSLMTLITGKSGGFQFFVSNKMKDLIKLSANR